MVTLDQVLRTGVSGLTANQVALNTTSNNIANVNTDGYVRKQAGFETNVLAGVPTGVKASKAIRAVNRFLAQEERVVLAQEKRFEAMKILHDQFQTLLGSPGDDLTFTGRLDKAFQQIAGLATDPAGNVRRMNATNHLQDYANEINRVSKLLQDLRSDADIRVSQTLISVNNEINFLNQINPKIVRAISLGEDSSSLVEQRDKSIRKLSEFIDVGSFRMEGGAVGITTGNGQVLLDQLKRELTYESVGTLTTKTEFEQIKIQKVNPDGTLTSVDVLDPFLNSGFLFGLLEMRDVQIPNMLSSLGQISGRVIDELNRVHNNNSTVPAPAFFEGRNVGVLAADNHNFTGKTTIATIDGNNKIVDRLEIDFTAGTTSKNGGGAAAIGGNTIQHIITAVNTQFGGTALSLVAGKLSLQAATGTGVAILQDESAPSSRGGRGFAHFFGFNDLMTSNAPATFETGMASGDVHGFGSTGAVKIDLIGSRGQNTKSFNLDFAAAGATSLGDVINVLNTGFAGFASFSLSQNGELLATPGSAFSDHHFSIINDTTARGNSAIKFSEFFGISRDFNIDRAFRVNVRSDIFADPSKLALAQLDLGAAAVAKTAPALTVGDPRGVIALQKVATNKVTFSAVGDINSTTNTLQEYAALVLADAAIKANQVENRFDDSAALRAEVAAKVKNDSGVNLDEELANMILYQNAFNASARLVASTRQMFDELLNLAN